MTIQTTTFSEFKAWMTGFIDGRKGEGLDKDDCQMIINMMNNVEEQPPVMVSPTCTSAPEVSYTNPIFSDYDPLRFQNIGSPTGTPFYSVPSNGSGAPNFNHAPATTSSDRWDIDANDAKFSYTMDALASSDVQSALDFSVGGNIINIHDIKGNA